MFSKQHIKKSLIPHYICNYSLGGLKAAFKKTKKVFLTESWTNAVFSSVKKKTHEIVVCFFFINHKRRQEIKIQSILHR